MVAGWPVAATAFTSKWTKATVSTRTRAPGPNSNCKRFLRFEALEHRQLLATFEVSNLFSEGTGSLADAIDRANALPGADTIAFRSDLAGTIAVQEAYSISESVTIIGSGLDRLTLDGNDASSHFLIDVGVVDVTLSDMTLTGGRFSNWFGGAISQGGGAICMMGSGRLLLRDMIISDSAADGPGGAVFAMTFGGARVDLLRAVVRNNIAIGNGGGISADFVTLTDSVVQGNRVSSSSESGGGGISGMEPPGGGGISASTVSMVRSVVEDNSARCDLPKWEGTSADLRGGGVRADTITATDSVIRGNAVGYSTNDPNRDGSISGGGGGLSAAVINLTRTMVQSNSTFGNAMPGGGLRGATIQLVDSTIDRNTTNGSSSSGGGAWASTSIVVQGSTVSNNVAGGSWSNGGGLVNATQIFNSTISGNTVVSNLARGGGIFNGVAPLAIAFSTLTKNETVGAFSEGGAVWTGGGVRLTSSIVAGNVARAGKPDLAVGSLGVDATNSLIGDAHGTTLAPAATRDAKGNLIGLATLRGGSGSIDPLLAPLANRGGPTQTHGLYPNSPAINSGGPGSSGVTAPAGDQRGASRSAAAQGGAGPTDMGAFELSFADMAPFADTNSDQGVDGADIALFRSAFGLAAPQPADLNRDNVVDGADFLLLQRLFGAKRPNPPAAPVSTSVLPFGVQLALPAAAAGVTTHELQILKPGAEWRSIKLVSPTERSVWIDGLEATSAYQFRLRAANLLGWSEFSPVMAVTTANTAPSPISFTVSAYPTESLSITLEATDVEGHTLAVTTSSPAHGSVTPGISPWNVNYISFPGFVGYDSFTYTVNDGHGGTSTAMVRVRVSGQAEQNFMSEELVSLRANNGQYVGVENGGGGAVSANHSTVGRSEQFVRKYRSLYSYNGSYITGDFTNLVRMRQDSVIDAQGSSSADAIEFEIFGVDNDSQIALLAKNGNFVQAVNGGGGILQATASAIGPWETFRYETVLFTPSSPQLVDRSTTSLTISFVNPNIGGVLRVEHLAAGGSQWTSSGFLHHKVTDYAISNLQPGVAYDVRVVALSGISTSTSPTARYTTLAPPPAPPTLTGPSGARASETPAFQWNNVTYATSYELRILQNGTIVRTYSVAAAGGVTTSFTIPGNEPLVYQTPYASDVVAINAAGRSNPSNTLTFTTRAAPAATPTLISPTNGAVRRSVLTNFTWNNSAHADDYILQLYVLRQTGVYDAIENRRYVVTRQNGGTTSYDIGNSTTNSSPLDYSRTYYWTVTARNSERVESAPSERWSFITLAPNIVDSPTLGNPVNNATRTRVNPTFEWSNVANAARYVVQLYNSAGTALDERRYVIDSSGSTTTSFTIGASPGNTNDLQYDRDYSWEVRGQNADGDNGPVSARFNFRTRMAPVTSAPALDNPVANAPNAQLSPEFRWFNVPEATDYVLQLYVLRNNPTRIEPIPNRNYIVTRDSGNITAFKFTDPGSPNVNPLDSTRLYYWDVQGRNGQGDLGPLSERRSFTTRAAIAVAIGAYEIAAVADGSGAMRSITTEENLAAGAPPLSLEPVAIASLNKSPTPSIASRQARLAISRTSHEPAARREWEELVDKVWLDVDSFAGLQFLRRNELLD